MYKTLSDPITAIVFYAIAFGLEFVAAVALAPVIGELAVLVGMFTPTIAALVMLLLVTRDGYTCAGWAGLGLHRLGMRVWWFALLAPLVVLGGAYGVVWGTGLASFGVSADIKATNPLLLPLLAILSIAKNTLTSSLGEELGWRGYLLPHLESLGQRRALLLSGLLPLIGYTLVAGWLLYRMHRRPSSAAAEPAGEGQPMAI